MKEDKNFKLEEMLKDLKIEYIAALPKVITKIEAFAAEGDKNMIREEFHKLKGTGKTYGLDEVSIYGNIFEKLCIDHPEQLESVLSTATEILGKIHSHREKNSRYNLEEDSDFIAISKRVE